MADIASTSQLEKLFAAGDNFDRWLVYLKTVRPKYVGTPMLAKIDAAIASGESKKSTMTKTLTAARDGWNWMKSEGAGAWDWLKNQTGLGFAPLAIPVGYWVAGISATAIISALAVLNNWVNTEAATTKNALDQFDKNVALQVSQGVPASEAIRVAGNVESARAAADAAKPGITDKLVDKAGTLVAWGIGLFVVYKIAEKKGWI